MKSQSVSKIFNKVRSPKPITSTEFPISLSASSVCQFRTPPIFDHFLIMYAALTKK